MSDIYLQFPKNSKQYIDESDFYVFLLIKYLEHRIKGGVCVPRNLKSPACTQIC